MSSEPEFTIKQFSPYETSELISLNKEYQHRYPKAELINEEKLNSPVFEGGKNLIYAADDTGKLAGYIPLQPHLMKDSGTPHLIWANMVVLPTGRPCVYIKDWVIRLSTKAANTGLKFRPDKLISE